MITNRQAAVAATLLLGASAASAQGPGPEWLGASPQEVLRTLGSFSFGSSTFDHGEHSAGHAHHHADHIYDPPIGVMGAHLHEAGSWMVSLRVSQMHMAGLRANQTDLSTADVFARGFSVTPTQMDTEMVMLGCMYAPSDDVTLMVGVPYVWKSMDHVTSMGGRFNVKSQGVGDTRLTGLYRIHDGGPQQVLLNFGISLPTGSTSQRDYTPAGGANSKLPYPMQIGTGTVDLLPGATYAGHGGPFSWGAQGIYRIHLDENDEGYRRGDRAETTAWIGRSFGGLKASWRLRYAHWEDIHGQDPELDPTMVPTADPQLQGGDRIDALIGLSWERHGGAFDGHRLALEWGVPVYQHLNGPQLETDWMLTLGWQASF